MSGKLSDFVKKNYPDSKSDLFAVFIERCDAMTAANRYQAMITQHAWMFLSSFEKLREKLLKKDTINMVHLGARAFEEIGGEVVQTTSFILRKSLVADYSGTYCRLIEPTTQQGKENMFLAGENRYVAKQSNFSKIPGSPVAYWVSEKILRIFEVGILLGDLANVPKGLSTGSVDLFVRYWYEPNYNSIDFNATDCEDTFTEYKWYPYAKGGEFRKWNGNLDFVVNWQNDGYDVKHFVDNKGKQRSRPQNTSFYFKKCMTYSAITSYKLSIRYLNGCIFGGGGDSIHTHDNSKFDYIFGFVNSTLQYKFLGIISPTLNFEVDHIKKLPIIFDNSKKALIKNLVINNSIISKSDWDAYETSWDFACHPLIRPTAHLSEAYDAWKDECKTHFLQLKANEEELNRIFISIYGLGDELSPDVADRDITVHRIFDTKDDIPEDMRGSNYVRTKQDEIVSLISYAVGCMFGRYSLDVPGLVYAGGDFNKKYCRWMSLFGEKANDYIDENGYVDEGWAGMSLSEYDGIRLANRWEKATFPPVTNNIIPICDDNEYFENDITKLFINWVEAVYGKGTLEENLKFIANALGGNGSPREVIRNYFINDFFDDHCKVYQKRPIYWLFDSGKKNGFKALIYMHRYQSDLLARLRTDYVHEQQERYRTQLSHLADAIDHASASERVKLTKQQKKIQDQALEIQKYEEKVHHLADQNIQIDLDDGVKHNYELFADVLAKIK